MSSNGFVGDLFDLSFSRFITAKWIKLLFLVGLAFIALQCVGSLLFALIQIFTADSAGPKVLAFIIGVFDFIGSFLAIIMLRISLELVVVVFRIEEHARRLAGGGPVDGGQPGFPVMPPTPSVSAS